MTAQAEAEVTFTRAEAQAVMAVIDYMHGHGDVTDEQMRNANDAWAKLAEIFNSAAKP